jgi:hypothetical protein
MVGEEYYRRAHQLEKEGYQQQAKECFRKSVFIFEQITTQFPGSAQAEYAGHLIVDCLSRFGDKYCGAYVVWHTLHYYGLTKPIDIISEEMQIEKKGSISIYEIDQTLQANGISAHSVKLDLEKLSAIDRPFVQYIAPAKNGQFGHFRLCIPNGSDKAVILDGAEEPKLFDLSYSEDYDYQGTKWDGTSILIDGIIKDISNDELSQFLTLDGMLLLAASWVESVWDAWSGADITIGSHLSLDLQLSLRGGCYWDCKSLDKDCYSSPECESNLDCEQGRIVCADETKNEECRKPGSWPNCKYDPAHYCKPKKRLTGVCSSSSYRCIVENDELGDCDTGTGIKKTWIRQCYR